MYLGQKRIAAEWRIFEFISGTYLNLPFTEASQKVEEEQICDVVDDAEDDTY